MSKIIFSTLCFLIFCIIFIKPVSADDCPSGNPSDDSCHQVCVDQQGNLHSVGDSWSGECSSTPHFRTGYTCNEDLTITIDELEDETCDPDYTPSPPVDTLPANPGSCDVVRVPIGPRGGVRKEVRDNCTKPGYKPHPIYGITDRCECVLEATQLCAREGSDCNQDPSTCQAQPGCNDYRCIGLVPGRTPGRCQNPSNICSNENAPCSIHANCQSGGGICSQYTCWTIGRGKQCRFGIQPTTKKVCKSKSDRDFDPDKHTECALAGGIPCDNNTGFKTAIGCIHTSPVALTKDLLKFVLGISGGLAFLMMLLGAFQMLTSAGNPETLQTGKDRLTSAVVGLLFVIFSVLLLQIIGFGILKIPGFE